MFLRPLRRLISIVVASCTMTAAVHADDAIIINHECTTLDDVPLCWIEIAKAELFASYGHTSHGSQLISGMNRLNDWFGCDCDHCGDAGCPDCLYGWCDDYGYYKYGSGHQAPVGVLSLWDGEPEGANDLGNPNRTAWEQATRDMLEDPRYVSRNVVIWSWCGQADTSPANIQIYLDLMSGLEQDYPDVTFVYMTGHLNGTGDDGNLHLRNEQIRQHCLDNGCVLFDFADIESYDPDGVAYLHLDANDNCDYWVDGVRYNWADEWCAMNPGDALCASCSCAHSKALNCNLKGRAFWWMMARIAGWDGVYDDCNTNGIEDGCDIANGTSLDVNGNGIPDECEGDIPGDLDGDGDVDLSDLGILLASYDIDDGGDLDGDGDTDLSDLGILLANYGYGL